ncbi:MAG: RNA 2',3'-cyclic phosphodiesterase [Dehalococcoidia bacterium]|nr:RNA 2',3'-cyclic phosphodiesterase [Dehalococcoidia bacterium]
MRAPAQCGEILEESGSYPRVTADSPTPPSFRAFVAVVPPLSAKTELEAVVRQLRQRDTDEAVRWVATDALHITLAFLGQITESAAAPLIDALRKETAGVESFELGLGSLGTFGDRRRKGGAQVVWAGPEGDVDGLSSLYERVTAAVRSVRLRVESRAFQPHITLGRVRRGHRWRLDPINAPSISSITFRVDSVTLMESQLGKGPAVYISRRQVSLSEP